MILVPRFSLTYANCYCTSFTLHCLASQFHHSFYQLAVLRFCTISYCVLQLTHFHWIINNSQICMYCIKVHKEKNCYPYIEEWSSSVCVSSMYWVRGNHMISKLNIGVWIWMSCTSYLEPQRTLLKRQLCM